MLGDIKISQNAIIQEMAKILIDYKNKNHIMASTAILEDYAEELYNSGYRKETDVVEEIFAEIEHTARAAIILLKFEKDEKIRNAKIECYTDLVDYISELKNKYTLEEK